MILYRGTRTLEDPTLPIDMAKQNESLFFTPYQNVAEWYGQLGFVSAYEGHIVRLQPHQGSTIGPPFNYNPNDYEALLDPQQIRKLLHLWTKVGGLL